MCVYVVLKTLETEIWMQANLTAQRLEGLKRPVVE